MIYLDSETLSKWKTKLGIGYISGKRFENNFLDIFRAIISSFIEHQKKYNNSCKDFEKSLSQIIEYKDIKIFFEKIEEIYSKAIKDNEDININDSSRKDILDETFAEDLFMDEFFFENESFNSFSKFINSYIKDTVFMCVTRQEHHIIDLVDAENQYKKQYLIEFFERNVMPRKVISKSNDLNRYDYLIEDHDFVEEISEELDELMMNDYLYTVFLFEKKKKLNVEEDILYNIIKYLCSDNEVLVECKSYLDDGFKLLDKEFYILEINPGRSGDFFNAASILLVISIFLLYLSGNLDENIFNSKIAREVFNCE